MMVCQTEISILPTTKWDALDPGHGLLEELTTNPGIRARVLDTGMLNTTGDPVHLLQNTPNTCFGAGSQCV